ncbi:hypothetical protein [Alkalinema sp. FACHB-956]|uniref:hypothetical protein n=1 Tax=Alkalinema sp. FACHB-956 TaxID=2692768 RepID=UPI0016846E00|nr:hypothetical protein [Alkalinema sp. FACHB-956]MBD2328877.1 hypothetical protein [Alkalinema sp. FACHB-956]
MTQCPCCSTSLLRYVKRGQVEWFCPRCWQTMPHWPTPSLSVSVGIPKPAPSQPVQSSLAEG